MGSYGSGKVWSRRAEGAGFESNSIPYLFFLPSFFFPPFFVSLFSTNKYINMHLNINCYLIKYNKQQEKYRFSREKTVHRILTI